MSLIYVKKSGAKIYLPIEINTKLIFVLTISLFVIIVFYYVFPDHIRYGSENSFLIVYMQQGDIQIISNAVLLALIDFYTLSDRFRRLKVYYTRRFKAD